MQNEIICKRCGGVICLNRIKEIELVLQEAHDNGYHQACWKELDMFVKFFIKRKGSK